MEKAEILRRLEYLSEHTIHTGGRPQFSFCMSSDDWLALKNAIAMLKEQEAKEAMVEESTNLYTGLPVAHCPKCGVSLDRFLYGRRYEGQINYCPFCGQAIKWE